MSPNSQVHRGLSILAQITIRKILESDNILLISSRDHNSSINNGLKETEHKKRDSITDDEKK